jgi:hypothetical protein
MHSPSCSGLQACHNFAVAALLLLGRWRVQGRAKGVCLSLLLRLLLLWLALQHVGQAQAAKLQSYSMSTMTIIDCEACVHKALLVEAELEDITT